MPTYTFEPNDLGKEEFNLKGPYEGRIPHNVLREAFGNAAYRRLGVQINFFGGFGAVEVLVNPGLENGRPRFELVGTISRG